MQQRVLGTLSTMLFAILITHFTATNAYAICGDGTLDGGEVCDDGDTNDGDCCSSDCQVAAPTLTGCDDGNPCTPLSGCNGSGQCNGFGCDIGQPCGIACQSSSLFCKQSGGTCTCSTDPPRAQLLLVVVDVNGKIVGPVFDLGTTANIAVSHAGQVFRLNVTESGFEDGSIANVQFESGDCTGVPLREPDQFRGFVPAAHPRNSAGVIYFPNGEPPMPRTFNSSLDFPFPAGPCATQGGTIVPPDGCCRTANGPSLERFALDAVPMDSIGVPPFHVEGP